LRESWSRLHRRVANAKLNGAENAKWNIEGWDRPGQPLRYPVPCKSICHSSSEKQPEIRILRYGAIARHRSCSLSLAGLSSRRLHCPRLGLRSEFSYVMASVALLIVVTPVDGDGDGEGGGGGGADIKFSRPRAGEPIRRLQRRQLTGPNERVPRSS
jgi:hypothetical protein